jgi:hypothetical protein
MTIAISTFGARVLNRWGSPSSQHYIVIPTAHICAVWKLSPEDASIFNTIEEELHGNYVGPRH